VFALENIDLENKLENFSGGEITKIFLTKLFEQQVDFLLFDEPTNNLDITARKLLYNKISTEKRGIIVISHDRALLEIMDIIIELTPLGVTKYGGNYSFYLEQKQLASSANLRHMNDAKKLLQKTELSIQLTREKREQRTAAGERLRKSGSQDKMLLDKMQQDATSNQKKISARENAMRQKAQAALEQAKNNIYHSEEFKFDLAHTKLATKKLVVKLSQIDFAYSEQSIIKNFSLTIIGPERIAIAGANGSGKSTLVKLIQGELTPQSGTRVIGVSNISYLDQHADALNPKLSILDNFYLFNPNIKTMAAYHCLAQFLFRNVDALKIVSELSGGEKLRALLACVLMAEKPPELIILDEPTNHLDLESIATLEASLQQYQGALIVVSHDTNLLANLKIDRTIEQTLGGVSHVCPVK